ncbi:hypothetical protein [Inquilinus sp. CA228]|uniref:hypothetical protein n=1 Tax=Inquilinus sp. CA228 TaxID=3455609 RepID=UPI003F8D0A84
MVDRAYLERLSRELTDEGKLIEAGWVGLRLAAIPEGASKTQLQEMRKAFFAGAQHLFSSIMTILDGDREPTADDLRRMNLIDVELRSFAHDLEREISGTGARQ